MLVVVQSSGRVRLFTTPWTAACQALPVPHRLPEFAQVHIHGIGDAILSSHHNSNALYDHLYLLA